MLTRFLTLLALSSIALVPSAARSQQVAADDTLRAPIPTVEAERVGATLAATSRSSDATMSARRRVKLPLIFYGALTVSAGAVAVLHVDPDSGGYRDGWTTATDFPDKAIHALAAWALTTVGVDLGARPRHAALAVCAAGTAFEFAPGYVSPSDMAAARRGAPGAAPTTGRP